MSDFGAPLHERFVGTTAVDKEYLSGRNKAGKALVFRLIRYHPPELVFKWICQGHLCQVDVVFPLSGRTAYSTGPFIDETRRRNASGISRLSIDINIRCVEKNVRLLRPGH